MSSFVMHTHLLYDFVPNRRYAFTWTRLLTHICVTRPQRDNGDVKWLLWRLELPVNALFVQQFAQINNRETWKVRVTALCAGKPPVTSGFPAQRDSDTEIFLFDDVIMSNLREKYDVAVHWRIHDLLGLTECQSLPIPTSLRGVQW